MTDSSVSLKLAVWQAASTPADIDANITALDTAAADAAAQGAQLLVTPEMFITGYNIGEQLLPLAKTQPLERVREIAARHSLAIVAGGPEWHSTLKTVTNSAWFVGADGKVLAKHRKVQLYGMLDAEHFEPGTRPHTSVDYAGFRIAMLVCFDVEFPEAVRAAAQHGAHVLAVPTANMAPFTFVNEHLIRVRAWENSMYIAYANQVGDDNGVHYVGRSVIASPFGEHLAQGTPAGDELLFATVSSAQCDEASAQNPYLTELNREVFQ